MITREVVLQESIIQFANICFSYDKPKKQVLNITKWQVRRGEHTFISGASGSGKSTLLNLISGINRPDSGELVVLGEALPRLSARKLDKFRAQKIGVIFQQLNLIPYLSVEDNILLAGYFANQSEKSVLQKRMLSLLTKLNLSESVLQQKANELSVGQQQRVAIVRAMINQPEILIADEPTSALDNHNKQSFLNILLELVSSTDCTLLFVSHDSSLEREFKAVIDMSELNSLHNEVLDVH